VTLKSIQPQPGDIPRSIVLSSIVFCSRLHIALACYGVHAPGYGLRPTSRRPGSRAFHLSAPNFKKLRALNALPKALAPLNYQPCLCGAGLSGTAKNSGLLPELQQGGIVLDRKIKGKNETTKLLSSSNLSMKLYLEQLPILQSCCVW
jgi:hypothetical protein